MEQFYLADGFSPVSDDQWRASVRKVLGEASFEMLRTHVFESLTTEPLYTAHGTSHRASQNTAGVRFAIVERAAGFNAAEAARCVTDAVTGGADAVWFGQPAPMPGKTYFPYTSRDAAQVLGSSLPLPAIYLDSGGSVAAAALFAGFAADGNRRTIAGCAGLDPISAIAETGEAPADHRQTFAEAVDAAFHLRIAHPAFIPFLASGTVWHAAGASPVQELAFTLASATAYWRALTEAGMPIGRGAACIAFRLATGTDVFVTISKFRALRSLWMHAVGAAAVDSQPHVLAEMPYRLLTEADPHNNLLRGTAAAFGAILGGADAVCLTGYDAAGDRKDERASRLARNTCLVLREEALLGVVADAPGGSHYVETVTEALAAGAWTIFQSIERQGGILAAIGNGAVRRLIEPTKAAHTAAIAKRVTKITGVSAYPNLKELLGQGGRNGIEATWTRDPVRSRLNLPSAGRGERFAAAVEAAKNGASLFELQRALSVPKERIAPPLADVRRDAEPFERLRAQADAAYRQLGSRPPVFLALLGTAEENHTKANWLRGFLASGGIEAIGTDEVFVSSSHVVAAFEKSPAPVACLGFLGQVGGPFEGVAEMLKEAGSVSVYLACSAGDLTQISSRDMAAIDRIVYDGCDAVAALGDLHRVLRVADLARASDDDSFAETGTSGYRPVAGR